MARLLERLPLINLWNLADGNKYTIDDDNTVLTKELAESDRKTDEAYNERYNQQPKGNSGKGKSKYRVEKGQLNIEKVSQSKETSIEEKERDGR